MRKVPKILNFLAKLIPRLRPIVDGIYKADEALDKVSDIERERRDDLVSRIRKTSTVIGFVIWMAWVVAYSSTVVGCQTVSGLRQEGYTVSHWDAFRLNVMDFWIGSDDYVDSIMDEQDKPESDAKGSGVNE